MDTASTTAETQAMVYPELFQKSSPTVRPTTISLDTARDTKALLATAIDELSETGRLVLSLHYYEQFSLEEVAEVLGCDPLEVERAHAAALTQLYAAGRLPGLA